MKSEKLWDFKTQEQKIVSNPTGLANR